MPQSQSILIPKLALPIGHTSAVCNAIFSPSGKYFLTLSRDESILLWDKSGRQLHAYELEHDIVTIFYCFSPDEDRFLTFEGFQLLLTVRDLAGTTVEHFTAVNPFDAIRSFIRTGKLDGVIPFFGPFKEIPIEGRPPTAPLGWKLAFSSSLDHFVTTRIPKGASALRSSPPTLRSPDGQLIELKIEDRRNFENGVAFVTLDGTENVLTCHKNMARVWNFDGKEVLTFFAKGGRQNRITGVVYAKSIERFIAVTSKDMVLFYDKKGGLDNMFKTGLGQLNSIVLTNSGDQMLICGSSGVKLFDLKGQLINHIGGGTSKVEFAEFSPLDNQLLTYDKYRYKQIITIWDPKLNKINSYFSAGRDLRRVGFDAEGKLVKAIYRDFSLAAWDIENDTESISNLGKRTLDQAAYARADDSFFTLDKLKDYQKLIVRIWNGNQQLEKTITIELTKERSHARLPDIGCSADGSLFAVKGPFYLGCYNRKGEELFSVDHEITLFHQKGVARKRDPWGGRGPLEFSPDNKYLMVASTDDYLLKWGSRKLYAPLRHREIFVFDMKGNVVLKFNGQKVWTFTFSPDGESIYLGYIEGQIEKYDFKQNLLASFKGHEAAVLSINFSHDHKFMITGSSDYTSKVWNLETAEELATLIQFDNDLTDPVNTDDKVVIPVEIKTEWVVTTPSGLFDASPGAMKELFYVLGTEIIELDQIKERFYEPGLLAKVLDIIPGDLREVAGFEKLDLFPHLQKFEIKQNKLSLSLNPRSGGIGKVSLFINNKEVIEDADPSRSKTPKIDLQPFLNFFLPGENKISVRLYNAEGWLKSAAYEIPFYYSKVKALGSLIPDTEPEEPEEIPDPSLHAVIVGTSQYARDELKLTYPDQDARLLAKALGLVGNLLFENKVHISLLSTDAESAHNLPTKENVKQAFSKIADSASPNDVLVVYFSGHGSNYGDGDKAKFYYITKDIRSGRLSDPVIREQGTISSNELTSWINAIPAKKQVLIFDTCHSGKVVDSLVEGKMVDSTQERAIERMKDRTGMFVLAGSSADKVSYEASRYGHGLLTYSLLWGMKGEALKTDSPTPTVDVMELFQYSRDKVPELAAEIGQEQIPVLSFPHGGESFALGIASDDSRQKIMLAQPRTVIIRTIFLSNDDFYDHLGLSEAVDSKLAQLGAQNETPNLIFVNLSKFPGAITMRGMYANSGDQYDLAVNLFQDGKMINDFSVTGIEKEVLLNKVVKELLKNLD
ncbi:MAG: caspase family protein [Bacteroidota bacterium]